MRLGGRLLRWKPIVHCQSDVVMIQHGVNAALECSFTRHTHSTRGTSLLRSTPILRYRNVVENTLADTPSGYIQDPANHPRQMVTYNKLSAEAEKTLDEMDRLRSLFSKEELLYVGYTTEAIQRLKQVVVNSKCSTEELREAVLGLKAELDKLVALVGEEVVVPGPLAELHEAAPGRHPKSKNPAIDDDEGLPDTPREHRLFVTVKDVNHVRYVLSLGLRRLNELDEAEALNLDILRTDRENVDALECLLEIFCGSERYHRVRDLLDIDNKATSESLTDGNVELTAPAPNCDSAQPLGPIASLVFSLLSDMMLEVAAQRFNGSGEGATSRYFLAALQPFSRVLSPIQLSHLLVTVVESMDQYLDTVCNHPAVTANAAKDVLGIAIALYRTILARNLHEMVFPEPIHFKMVVMHKQYVALRRADRREESYTAAESALNLYRSHAPSKTKDASDPLPSTATSGDESLEDCEGMYRQIYLQYVADRACDRSGGSHRRGPTSSPPTTPRSATRDDGHATRAAMTLCLGALEEYPSEPQPWVTLAVLLHRADAKGNLPQAISAARQALHCDPLHLTAIATLANFYKADGREALHATMMDRYHLLSFFIDEGASTEDLMATAEEIRDLEGRFGNGDASLGGTPKEAPLDDEAQKMMEATNHQLRKLVLRSPVIGEEVDQRPMPIFFPSQDPDINVERPPPLNDETCPPPPALG